MLRDYIGRYWGDFELPDGWSDENVASAPPVDATVTRWLRGERTPTEKQLPGIVAALNKILDDHKASSSFLRSKGAEADAAIASKRFRFDIDNIDVSKTPGHILAKSMGFIVEGFDDWWVDVSGPDNPSKLSSLETKLLGVYLCFRQHANESKGLQRDAVIFYENEERDGLRALLIGAGEPYWRGDVLIGRSTVSVLLQRQDELNGKQINTLSMLYDDDNVTVLHGYRTRVIKEVARNIGAYRVFLHKLADEKWESYLDENLEDDMVVRGMASFSEEIQKSAETASSFLQNIRGMLETAQMEIPGDDLIEKPSHDIFGLASGDIASFQDSARREKTNLLTPNSAPKKRANAKTATKTKASRKTSKKTA